MEVIKSISRIGNSLGVIIPDIMLVHMGLKKKKKVRIIMEGTSLRIEPDEGREAHLMGIAAKYIKRYRSDFKKMQSLAKWLKKNSSPLKRK